MMEAGSARTSYKNKACPKPLEGEEAMELTLTEVKPLAARVAVDAFAKKAVLPRRELLRQMALSREGDRREGILLRQGKGWFQVAGMGHEALAAVAYALRTDDYIFPYYRDRPIAVARGVSNYELALGYFAKAASGGAGRQMPSHFSNRGLNIFSVATPTAAQCMPAVGAAWGFKLAGTDQVALATIGDASTRQGEFYEALAFALQENLAIVFVVEDNRLGISTSTQAMFPFRIGALSRDVLVSVNGRDVDAIYAAASEAVARARFGDGPTVLQCELDRLCSHTSSDDQRLYRSAEDLTAEMMRDPIEALAKSLIDSGDMTLEEWEEEVSAIARTVDEDYRRADRAADPDPAKVTENLFAPAPSVVPSPAPIAVETKEPLSMVSAVNLVLAHALQTDRRVLLFGEDIEDPKGGVFGITKGLSNRFPGRVINAPLSESTIVGSAVGLAATGYFPIFEIQFIDFITPAINQLMQQVATLRYRSNGVWQCPMVLMAPYGAYLPGGGIWHSESNEGIWAHIHGLRVVVPSTPEDAGGLLWSAIHGGDPTLFLLPKHIFRKRDAAVVDRLQAVQFGQAAVRKTGWDVTLVTWGNCTELASEAIQSIEADGATSVEMIDLRTICPCDYETIARSLSKTGRLVVVHEDARTTGFGQSIITEITGRPEWFNYLLSPPQLVARQDVHVPFNPALEYAVLPSVAQVVDAIKLVMD
jgi:2-oxoisovalerate dehydrogenase E1 component